MFSSKFRIDVQPGLVQHLRPKRQNQRFEGLGFSPDGWILAAATADTNSVLLFRRNGDGRFDEEAYAELEGLHYPHDLSFAASGRKMLLAVAERSGAISVFEELRDGTFGPKPTFMIGGPEARLSHTDGVAFVPPFNDYLAACNLLTGTISFYWKTSVTPLRFAGSPEQELMHASMNNPDGLAFSSDGRWLAVANHGSHSVSVFERQGVAATGKTPVYGPEAVAVITDSTLRHTHSVAFTPGGHLVATNAGANYFCVYRMSKSLLRRTMKPKLVHQQAVADEAVFHQVNAHNKMEGGPKGVAVHTHTLAVCSPEIGIRLYPIRG